MDSYNDALLAFDACLIHLNTPPANFNNGFPSPYGGGSVSGDYYHEFRKLCGELGTAINDYLEDGHLLQETHALRKLQRLIVEGFSDSHFMILEKERLKLREAVYEGKCDFIDQHQGRNPSTPQKVQSAAPKKEVATPAPPLAQIKSEVARPSSRGSIGRAVFSFAALGSGALIIVFNQRIIAYMLTLGIKNSADAYALIAVAATVATLVVTIGFYLRK